MIPLCRCLREASLRCPRCAESVCSRCATDRPVCARCGETLLFDPDRFEAWLDAHLSDQLAARHDMEMELLLRAEAEGA